MSRYLMMYRYLVLINIPAYYELNMLTQLLRLTIQCLKVLRVRVAFAMGSLA